MAVAVLLGACGGSSSATKESAGTYHVRVTSASFPVEQDLGQTSLLRLSFRNTGRHTVPLLNVTFTIAGKQGADSVLPFGYRSAQPGLAAATRPVWVLAEHFPKLNGSDRPGGASTSNPKTFALGELKPGRTTTAVWELSAVKAGHYTVLYRVAAGIGGEAKAVTRGNVAPGGSFAVKVTSELPETEVTNNGEVVPIKKG